MSLSTRQRIKATAIAAIGMPVIEALGALIRAGFVPEASTTAVGLDPIEHTGLLPVTVQPTGD